MTARSFLTVCCVFIAGTLANAQIPDHPVITEVYFDPAGLNDGPVGRDPGNAHQEFIEIYLPPLSALAAGLEKDALRLALYEVEGDLTSFGVGLVNYRFDLPVFDLDPGNGITAGAIARPTSGVVVLGWVDYVGNPPSALAGTPGSRVALVNGGVTSTGGAYLFVAINGAQFGGTTNPDFAVVEAESLIDLPAEASTGVIQNGSAAYLLVNRDSGGYVQLCDDQHELDCAAGADPNLAAGSPLGLSALLDGFAGNDHQDFAVIDQPFSPGDDVDLETVLPSGGVFTMFVPQLAEEDKTRITPGLANGYARVFVDQLKTTENGAPNDPIEDALMSYRHVRNDGPFFPSPGKAALTTSAPELGVAVDTEQFTEVLSHTTGRPGLLSANVGGAFGIDIANAVGASSNPAVATFATSDDAAAVTGQTLGFPSVAVTPDPAASHGASASVPVTVTATNSSGGDPAVVNPVHMRTLTATVLDPQTGVDQNGLPLEATVFAAVQGIAASASTNELLDTDLGAYLAAQPDIALFETSAHGEFLLNPATNLADTVNIPLLIEEFEEECCLYINPPSPGGGLDLYQTVAGSAEVLSGAGTYDDTIPPCVCGNLVNANSFNIPDTWTYGGPFSPSERVHFVDEVGFVGNPRSGLTNTTTDRTFELVIVDTHVKAFGPLETGATDDFGIIVEVELTEAGAPVVDGEFVFLSFTGGRQGADIDTLEVPPGNLLATLIYLDLDNLHDVLGIRSIERIYVVDGSGGGEVDVIEVFSLNIEEPGGCTTNGDCDDGLFCTGVETCSMGACSSPGDPCTGLGLQCNEVTDACDCLGDGECDDGLFCTGSETCVGGTCTSDGNPCTAMGMVCNEDGDACVPIPGCPGGTIAECADIDGNEVRDDNCTWWACVATECIPTEIIFGDMGGQFGACPPDGAADGNDRFHALNCFSNEGAGGEPYACEQSPPSAYNVDAGGQFGSCAPDGVCDGNDAFAALNAFGSLSPCSCPLDGGPAPVVDPVTVASATMHLDADRKAVRAGGLVRVHVWLDSALDDLRGYQLHLGVIGGRSGTLELVDISTQRPADKVDAVLADYDWAAFNLETAQMVVGLDGPGVAVEPGYLATFTYRATADASGRFAVQLLSAPDTVEHRTFLFPTVPGTKIEVGKTGTVTIDVRSESTRMTGR